MDGVSTTDLQSSVAVGSSLYGDFNPEKEIEILVNDQPLPLNVTLATIRHCMWKNGGDVILQYRSVNRETED